MRALQVAVEYRATGGSCTPLSASVCPSIGAPASGVASAPRGLGDASSNSLAGDLRFGRQRMAKQDVIDEHKLHGTDTGSPEVQIALLTARINHLTDHLKRTRRTTTAVVAC